MKRRPFFPLRWHPEDVRSVAEARIAAAHGAAHAALDEAARLLAMQDEAATSRDLLGSLSEVRAWAMDGRIVVPDGLPDRFVDPYRRAWAAAYLKHARAVARSLKP